MQHKLNCCRVNNSAPSIRQGFISGLDASLDFNDLQIDTDSGARINVNGATSVDLDVWLMSFDTVGSSLNAVGTYPVDESNNVSFDVTLKDFSYGYDVDENSGSGEFTWQFGTILDVNDITDGVDHYSGTLKAETTQTFSGNNANEIAYAGALKVTGAGASVALTAIGSNQVRIDFDLGDDGSVDDSATVPWDVIYFW